VPGSSGSWKLFFLSMLETEWAVKAVFTPATPHDRGKADAARRCEDQGHRVVQLPLMEQPMLHHPSATSATASLRRASAMMASCIIGGFAMRIEVSHPSSEMSGGLGKIGHQPVASRANTSSACTLPMGIAHIGASRITARLAHRDDICCAAMLLSSERYYLAWSTGSTTISKTVQRTRINPPASESGAYTDSSQAWPDFLYVGGEFRRFVVAYLRKGISVRSRSSRRKSPPQISAPTMLGNRMGKSGSPVRTWVAVAPPR
jgi:hypothetical protein